MGWNMAFFCVGIIAFITTAYLIFVFPKVPGGESFSIKQMPEIFKNKTLMGIFLVTFLFATSYYTGYSYIEPFLQKVAGLSDNWVTTTLTIFGAAGLLGSFLFSHYYDKNKYLFVKLVMMVWRQHYFYYIRYQKHIWRLFYYVHSGVWQLWHLT